MGAQMKILVDSREPRERYSFLTDVLKLPVEFRYLEIGDVVIGDWCIEAKTVRGFIKDVMDKRLFRQAIELVNGYKHPVIVITELPMVLEKYRPIFYGAMASLMVRFGIPVVSVLDDRTYNMLIGYIYSQVVGKPTSSSTLPFRRPQRISEAQVLMLQCIRGLGRKKAIQLLEKYKTIDRIASLSVHELSRVSGISERIANNIWRVFHSKYGTDEVFE